MNQQLEINLICTDAEEEIDFGPSDGLPEIPKDTRKPYYASHDFGRIMHKENPIKPIDIDIDIDPLLGF
jgi:hypothetical protein